MTGANPGGRRRSPRGSTMVLIAGCLLGLAPANAGHELPFYPSYYPQEIRMEPVDLPTAATLLSKSGGLHAYIGGDPFEGGTVPPNVSPTESLGSYLVVTFNTASGAWNDRETRCARAREIVGALAAVTGGYTFHPYPVTPYHADYLQHADLVEAAKKAYAGRADPALISRRVRIRADGALAETLPRAGWGLAAREWDVRVEAVEVADLVAPQRIGLNGWLGPPWLKEGWFHAYLLQAGALTDPGTRQAAEALGQRLVTGAYDGAIERLNLERQLVSLLGRGCERTVAAYVPKREYFSSDFSDGVENVAYDAHAGFNSAIFLRTVKLKDFPWNGWLRLGIAMGPAAAWNPIGGFTDTAGRLLWLAVGDPAFFPEPDNASWIGNRVTLSSMTPGPVAGMGVPKDALLPELGTGLLQEVGPGTTARAKFTYKVLTSAFHDGSRMTTADVLYPFVFAFRWGARDRRSTGEHDQFVDSSTALLREWLAGLRVVRVDTDVREFGEVRFVYVVHTVELYTRYAGLDPQQVASVAAPWSPVPWHLIALMEEAVRQGIAAFSEAEATRRGIPWLDLVRHQPVKDRLGVLVEGFERQGYIPNALKGLVTPAEARERWAALKQFSQKSGHFLVTNGPYRLETWSGDRTVLQVFRDFTYPLGVGSYDRYPIPRRAYVSKIETRGDRLVIHAEVERIEKFMRDHRIVREPLAKQPAGADDLPVCRYVIVGPDGAVVRAGTSQDTDAAALTVSLKGPFKPGVHTILVALSLGGNAMNPEVATLSYPVKGSP